MKAILIIMLIFYSTNKTPEIGMASWYGPGFHGRKTASGVLYDQNKMVAAHKSLPFGTIIKVTNLSNNISVDVKVVDRGPYSKGRIVDVSSKAADILKFKHKGTTKVKIEKIN